MSKDAYYEFDKCYSQMDKSDLEEKKFECQCLNDHLWSEILAYMAATPPAMIKNDDNEEYPYPEFLVSKLHELRDEIEGNAATIARLDDYLDAMNENADYDTWDD